MATNTNQLIRMISISANKTFYPYKGKGSNIRAIRLTERNAFVPCIKVFFCWYTLPHPQTTKLISVDLNHRPLDLKAGVNPL